MRAFFNYFRILHGSLFATNGEPIIIHTHSHAPHSISPNNVFFSSLLRLSFHYSSLASTSSRSFSLSSPLFSISSSTSSTAWLKLNWCF